MHAITVMFQVKPEFVATFLPEMTANARASLEREPGCRQFDVCVDPASPATVFLYEVYDSKAAFDAHLASPHFKQFNEATASWVAAKTVQAFERVFPA